MWDGVDEDVRKVERLGGHLVGNLGGIWCGVEDVWVTPCGVRREIEGGKGGGKEVV